MTHIFDTNLKPVKLYLNSKNYTYKKNDYSSYIFQLNNVIQKYSNMYFFVSLNSFTFTNSIFNINDNNSNIYYSFAESGLGAVFNVRVYNGNYNIDELITNLNERCTGHLNFVYNSVLLKITITSLQNTGFRFISEGKSNLIYKLLGFDEIIQNETLHTTQTSKNIINLNSNLSLNITLENLVLQTNNVKGEIHYNTLANIPILSSFGETQYFEPTDNFKYVVENDSINQIDLNILNQNFEPVDFNGIDFYCTLTFDFSYIKELIVPKTLFGESETYYNYLRDKLLENEKDKILQN